MAQNPQAGQVIGQAVGQGVAQALKSAGIGTLPQQGQNISAKAPMSMAPQGSGVAISYAPMLEKMPIQKLLTEFMNPGSQIPKYALLGAIDQAQKKNKAMQSVQGQMAMAQNAQAQQQGTVTDQVMGEAMQGGIRAAATGGVMRYAGGGLTVDSPEVQAILAKAPEERTESELSILEQAGPVGPGDRALRKLGSTIMEGLHWLVSSPQERRKDKTEKTAPRAPMYIPTTPTGFEGIVDAVAPSAAASSAKGIAAAVNKPSAQQPAAPAKFTTAEQMGPDVFDFAYGQQKSALEQASKLTPEQQEAQNAEIAQMRSNIASREKRAADTADLNKRMYERAMKDTEGIGAEGLFAIASAMGVPRKGGDWVAGLTGGASRVLGAQREQRQKAEENWIRAQTAANSEQNIIDEMRLTKVQRDRAIKDGNAKLANDLTVKLADLGKEMAVLRYDQQQKTLVNQLALSKESREAERQPYEIKKLQAEAAKEYAYGAAAGIRGESKGALTWDQANDNVQKFLESTQGMMEIARIRKEAQAQGKPVPSLLDIKNALIQQELQSAGVAGKYPGAGQQTGAQLPPGVTVTKVGG